MGSHQCKFDGNILPLFGDAEMEWPNAVRLTLYLLGLCWTFLAIALISDTFMAGIEKVTSLKKRVKDKKTGRTITVHVWNATVANLTLMALGSSAPEILLSVIEILTQDFFLGELGAGTIVGSAAFNLLCISAVCICAPDDGQVRFIKETNVYIITASCSVFAYLWLVFILMAPPTPNVCSIWEAVLTLMFCPALVYAAYLADRGWCSCRSEVDEESQMMGVIPENVTKEEIAQIEQQIRDQHGAHLTNEQVVSIMESEYFHTRSRAYYRHGVGRNFHSTWKKERSNDKIGSPHLTVKHADSTQDALEFEQECVTIGFATSRYAFLESCVHARLILVRKGPTHVKASVKYRTRDGTARAGSDYEAIEGIVYFDKEEVKKVLSVKIHDDNAYEENEEFYVDLFDPMCECDDGGWMEESQESCIVMPAVAAVASDCPSSLRPDSSLVSSRSRRYKAALSTSTGSAMVVIIDNDSPGCIRFQSEEVIVEEDVEEKTVGISVDRLGGASGTIGFRYHTEDMSGVAGVDYQEAKGTISLGPAVQSATIPVTINAKGRYYKTASFNLVITEATGGCRFDKETDGGAECCICHIIIKGKTDEKRMTLIQKMESRIVANRSHLGAINWRQQFYDAVSCVVEEDDDDKQGKDADGPSALDYVIHVVSLPWKLLFALVPPVDYCGGWACFFASLGMIACVTAIVGDMANLVGCCMNIKPEITAITFVALGTSLPDTFASKRAALCEPYADASIGNVTGSNSVNVFIGLGLSWSIAAFYWESGKPTAQWLEKLQPGGVYHDVAQDVVDAQRDGNAVFVVPAGSLWFNLMVFSFNAFFAIQHLYARRMKFGGELGGPKKGFMGQYFSASFLVGQWFLYVGASSIFATMK
mmetsp:Transcript_91608/g.144813  ORF Transcript_91608/g.144813 Transcript_91608/m.144813 type:complete len:877 (+) Transcript_91608:89-2719(+)